MEREHSHEIPDLLLERLRTSGPFVTFRRRAVLAFANNAWCMVCCTVEAFGRGEGVPTPVASRRYPLAVLYEDFLTAKECFDLAHQLQNGLIQFGDLDLSPAKNPQWTTEFFPLANDRMKRSGYVIELNFDTRAAWPSGKVLIAPNEPYYPDIEEAARDWLPFPVYHGHSDGRNDRILFLLPETRAFIADVASPRGGVLEVTLAGTEIDASSFWIKGAYWQGKSMRQLDEAVKGGKATLAVPEDADRLEYYLLDSGGTRYDFQRENRFGHAGLGRKRLNPVEANLVEQVRKACQEAEGLHVEFKPFIDPNEKLTEHKEKTKLHELLRTVVAFANTKGGRIYLGVNDDCSVPGIDQSFQKWAKAAIDESSLQRYLGTLKSRVKTLIQGEVTLTLSHATLDGVHVVIVEVPPLAEKPVAVKDDNRLYVRNGPNNVPAPPELWKSILWPSRPGD
jgi:hypothetical protein